MEPIVHMVAPLDEWAPHRRALWEYFVGSKGVLLPSMFFPHQDLNQGPSASQPRPLQTELLPT